MGSACHGRRKAILLSASPLTKLRRPRSQSRARPQPAAAAPAAPPDPPRHISSNCPTDHILVMANRRFDRPILPRLPSIEDAKISCRFMQNAQSFQVLKQSWVAQRCKYDTIPELGNAYWRTQQGQLSFHHLSEEPSMHESSSTDSTRSSINSAQSKEWMEKMDAAGRIYYVNINDKRTGRK